jgi:hypothetical protein
MDSTDQAAASAPAASTPASAQSQAPIASAATPTFKLTVKFAFADYQVGQQITDAAEVAAVLEGENAANVLKTAA